MSLSKAHALSGHVVPLCLAVLSEAVSCGDPEEPWHGWQVSLGSFAQMTMAPRGAETVLPEYHRWRQVEGGRELGLATSGLQTGPSLQALTLGAAPGR